MKMLKDSKYYFLMVLTLFVGFVVIELIGSCSVLLHDRLSFWEVIKRGTKLIVFASLSFGTLIMPLIILTTNKKFQIPIIFLFFFSLFALANLLHVRVFSFIIPLSMYSNVGNLSEFSDSVIKLLKISDLFYLVVPGAVLVVYRLIRVKIEIVIVKKRLVAAIALSCFSIISIIGYMNIFIAMNDPERLSGSETMLRYCNFIPQRFYCEFGCANSFITETVNSYTADKYIYTEKDKEKIESYLSSVTPPFIPGGHDTVVVKKNLVILLIESWNCKALTAAIGGQNIMPNVARLVNEPQTLVTRKIKHPEQNGMSIAGQFNILTGLIAPRSSVFPYDYRGNTYPSIIKAMKNKYVNLSSTTLVPTSKNVWGQDQVDFSLGVDSLFGKEELATKEEWASPRWLSDQRICQIAMDKLKQKQDQPFYMLVLTSDMHSPYVEASVCDLVFPENYPASLKVYYSKARNLDKYIGTFIDSLKKLDAGRVYQESLIVICADHNVLMPYLKGVSENEDMSDAAAVSAYTPVLFLNTGYDMREINKAMEECEFVQEQVFPTMLSLLKVSEDGYCGLFPSMLDLEKGKQWDFSDVSRSTPNQKLKEVFDVSELIIRSNYFGKGNLTNLQSYPKL